MLRLWVRLLVMVCLAGLAGCSLGNRETRYIESGKQFLKKKDYARAAVQFHGAIQTNPNNAEAHYQLALAEIGLNDYIAAERALGKCLELNPKNIDAQLKMAELLTVYNESEPLNQAQGYARTVLDAMPDDPDALDALAVAELKLGRRDESLQLLEQASRKAPAHLQTAVMLAAARLRDNDETGAEHLLRQAVEKAPESVSARMILGSFDLVVGKSKDAEQQFRNVLEKEPNHALALVDLAGVLNAAGRQKEAEQLYRRMAYGPASPYQPQYGRYLFQIGKQEEAVAEFGRLAKLNPKDVNARTRLVAAYLAAGRVGNAQLVLQAALAENPADAAALLQRSELYLISGAYDDARRDLNTVVHYAPDSDKAHFLLAAAERAQGNAEKQRQELVEVLRLNPGFFAARAALAQSFIADNQGQAALDLMNGTPPDQQKGLGFVTFRNWALLATGNLKEAQKGVDNGLAQMRTRDLLLQDALVKLQRGNDESARSPLLEILKNNPEDVGAINAFIRSYAAQKKLPAAIDPLRKLASQRPKSALLPYHLGVLLAATGKRQDARASFAAAVANNPQFVPARLALAAIDQADGKPDAARQELDPLLKSKQGELSARLGLSLIETKAGNYDKAIEHLRKVVDGEPNNVIALNNLAYLLADHTSDFDEALKYAQKAKELAPDDINVEGTIGWAYFRKGLYGMALQHLQQAVKREGDHVIAGTAIRRYHLAMAYKKAGDGEKAAKTLTAALKLNPDLPEARMAMQMMAGSK